MPPALRREEEIETRIKQFEPINRLHEVVRAKRCDGETGQAGNRDNPSNDRGTIACIPDWDLVCRPIRASSLQRLHQQAGQKTAPDQCARTPNYLL